MRKREDQKMKNNFETETTEYKRSTSELRKGIISISSILNKHQQETLIFGIGPDGSIPGQDVTDKTLRNVSEAISNHITPRIYPIVKRERIGEKDCILVKFSGHEIPYFAYGRAYMRVSDQNKQLSPSELQNMILDHNREKLRWNDKMCKEASFEDIDQDKVKDFLYLAGREYDDKALEKMDLVRRGRLTNTAVMLFGKEPERFFPFASELRCAVFATDDTTVMIDMKDFRGDLLYLIDEAEKYFLKNIHIGMRIEGLRRIDVPEIDKDAFREAIINAFSHRNYWKPESVRVAVFKDRVEVRSPGLLIGGLTIEEIRKGNVSDRRNPQIADKFKDIHFVENWGTGIGKILDREPKTEFKEVGNMFITTFYRPLGEPEKGVEKGVEKLNEKQKRILEVIKRDPYISKKRMKEKLHLGKKAIDNNIAKLKQKGRLKRIGPARGGHWEIITEEEESET